jgi:hypothetical protein
MFTDLNMLLDQFLRCQPLSDQFLIKTHPDNLVRVQFFIDHYRNTRPSIAIKAKALSYLPKGEYEVHVQRRKTKDGMENSHACNRRYAA